MTFQAYLDSIKEKTGKTPEDFRAMSAEKGLSTYREVLAWLKEDFALGHGHANAMAQLLINADKFQASPEDKLGDHFAGGKAKWRSMYEGLVAQIAAFGDDVKVAPNQSYINVQRRGKKFAILQPSTADRFDIGIKLKGAASSGRFEEAGSWNPMVTHRVQVTDPMQIDDELMEWLRRSYDAA